ncbi:MAG: VCBS repeat-containing protein [Acidobacteria bacterium]|nr:VCBS repeat-containing protein [Acidobacteriota bacterium]
MNRIATTLILLALALLAAPAATYNVGPGRPYTTLQDVAGLLNPGDLVLVDGNATYPGDLVFERAGGAGNPITIRGVRVSGNRPVISGGTNTVTFMSPWPYTSGADHYVFEGFEVTAGSFRGVYHQADDLVLRDVVVHDCPAHGILGADLGSGSLLMEYCEVYRCGNGSSQHQIYMSTDEGNRPGSVFRMQFCYLHEGLGGNNVKSRAERNEIYYNWIEGGYYHELELIGSEEYPTPTVREDSDVVGNVFWKKTKPSGSDNFFFVTRVGGDGTGETFGRYRFVNNTFLCGSAAAFRIFDGIQSIEMHNNVFYRIDGTGVQIKRTVEANWSDGELIAGSNNWVQTGSTEIPVQWTGTLTGADPGFVGLGSNDPRPAAGSVLIDHGAGSLSGPPGFPFPNPLFPPAWHPPLHAFQAPGTAAPRPVDATLDIGAYEYYTRRFHPDFNLDGKTDFLWRSVSTGDNSAWLMNGVSISGSPLPLPAVGTGWEIAGAADFNADGRTDILWRNPSAGINSVWYLSGTAVTAQAAFPSVGAPWALAGVADFSGDGNPDLLWRNSSTGDNSVWVLSGTTVTGSLPLAAVGTAWTVAALADFSGDGKTDILWRNPSTGVDSVWVLDGTSYTGSLPFPTVGTAWEIQAAGDFSGDGKADVVWRNTTPGAGDLSAWILNGTAVTSTTPTVPSAVSDVSWVIVN